MTLETYQKEKIIQELLKQRENFEGSDREFCLMYDINAAIYSRLKKGDRDKVLGNDRLVNIGRKLHVNFKDRVDWKIVETETYRYIWAQLAWCQENGESAILVDNADIGKSTTAKAYKQANKNVFYVDCSQTKTRVLFMKALAKACGVSPDGRLNDVYQNTIYAIQCMDNPLVILDEAGDLDYLATLEIKSYWNALEGSCGWYMMGADGLKAKIERNIAHKVVGYTEIYRRFGKSFKKAVPEDPAAEAMYLRAQVKAVAAANLEDEAKINEVLQKGLGLTNLKTQVRKANGQKK